MNFYNHESKIYYFLKKYFFIETKKKKTLVFEQTKKYEEISLKAQYAFLTPSQSQRPRKSNLKSLLQA